MKAITETEYFQKVDVKDELPESGFNTVKYNDGWRTAYFHPAKTISEQWSDDIYGTHLTHVDSWLKPATGFVFSKEQLRERDSELIKFVLEMAAESAKTERGVIGGSYNNEGYVRKYGTIVNKSSITSLHEEILNKILNDL